MKFTERSLLRPVWSVVLAMSTLAVAVQGGTMPVLTAVEIVEVKTVGVSAAEESRSIVQVRWRTDAQGGAEVKSFEVAIEVGYADGAIEKRKTTTAASTRSTRFEVPTLHFSAGRPGAELKTFRASVVVSFTETATRQGPF